MTANSRERQFAPFIIFALVALAVVLVALWTLDRSAYTRAANGIGGEAAGAGGSAGGSAPGAHFEWKMITTWPKNFPGLGSGPENFARYVDEMSNGRLKVRVYGAGEIVPPFGVFDTVSQGAADAGHGASYYWKGKLPSAVFFTSVPFGLNAQEMNGWLHYGGGLELWQEAYAPYNLVPMAGGNSGVQMAGWFNREINSVADLKGLKMRIPGLAGEVFSAVGGTAVRISGNELYTSLQTGVIDALEWVGPYNDIAFGFQELVKYYYYPGWHETGSTLEFIFNADALAALPADLQAIVKYAARATNQDMLDEYTARNNAALTELVETHGVQLRQLPDDVLLALYRASEVAMKELVSRDPMAAKVNASYQRFYRGVRNYHHISEQAYINIRDRVMDGAE